jgi:hypothetical protein
MGQPELGLLDLGQVLDAEVLWQPVHVSISG